MRAGDLVSTTRRYSPTIASGEVFTSTVTEWLSVITMRAFHLFSDTNAYRRALRSSSTGTVISVRLLYVGFGSSIE